MASCIDHLGILAATFLCLSVAVSSAAFSKETSPHDGAQSDLSGGRSMPVGVNGPMANIVVDQFGYPKNATKIAIIREPLAGYDAGTPYTPGHTFSVIERLSGNTVKSGAISSWNGGATHAASGDRVWSFDFSDVTSSGTYAILDVDTKMQSADFKIDDRVYSGVLRDALRMFFYQRAGFEKTPAAAGEKWSDAASHLGNLQDAQSRSWLDKQDKTLTKDLRGGWFDAGDFNKYTSWAARTIIVLLRAFDENPGAFGDASGIPESGNGIPDIIDEVRWGLAWLERMQNADGSVLCVQGLSENSPPSAATGPSYYGPPTTSASFMTSAAFAYASKIFSARPEQELRTYAQELAAHAERAFTWARANPDLTYYNNDETRQPGSKGLASGQQEMDAQQRLFAEFEAAVFLYSISGQDRFREFAEANYKTNGSNDGPNPYTADQHEVLLYFARLDGVAKDVKSEIIEQFKSHMKSNSDQLPLIAGKSDPYRAPLIDYVWGSNQAKAAQSRIYELFASIAEDPQLAATAKSAALDYLHYIHGVNPLGLVYLTNMRAAGAENSVNTMYHKWFSHSSEPWSKVTPTTPGPPPGYLVGGPNVQFAVDSCCLVAGYPDPKCHVSADNTSCSANFTPPLNQPPMKSYRQFNDDWPANSWQVTEPSTRYQATYILALAPFNR